MNKNIIALVLLFFSSGCKTDPTSFNNNRTYIGFWAETKWTYHFQSNGEYVLESYGHGGGDPQYGSYLIKDSLILLIPQRDIFDSCQFKQFKILNNHLIRDYAGYYYTESEEELEKISGKLFQEVQLLEKTIEELDLVAKKRKELIIQDSTKNYVLRNRGIVIKNGDDFFEYRIESLDIDDFFRDMLHLRLYAKYDPIRIFNDKFELIKEIKSVNPN